MANKSSSNLSVKRFQPGETEKCGNLSVFGGLANAYSFFGFVYYFGRDQFLIKCFTSFNAFQRKLLHAPNGTLITFMFYVSVLSGLILFHRSEPEPRVLGSQPVQGMSFTRPQSARHHHPNHSLQLKTIKTHNIFGLWKPSLLL